jgi:hypothetical protein
LAHRTTATDSNNDIDFLAMSYMIEGLDHLATLGIGSEVLIELAIVHRNLA